MEIDISVAYGKWRNEQKAAGRRPEEGATVFFCFWQEAREIGGTVGGNGRKAGEGWRLAEDDRRQRCAGLVESRARMGGQSANFNGWLSTMPVTAGLCGVSCVRTASVWRRTEGAKRLLLEAGRSDGRQMGGNVRQRVGGNSGRPCDCSGRQRRSAQGFRGQFGKGNSGAGGFSAVRFRGEVPRRSGRFRWGSLYGKGGGVAEKR